MGIEMHPRRVLIEAGREAMLGLVHGHAVDVIDPLADLVGVEAVERAREHPIEVARPQPGRDHQALGRDVLGQLGHHRLGRRAVRIALGDHHPAHELEDLPAVVLGRNGPT